MTRNRLIVVIVLVLAVAGAAFFLTGRGGSPSGTASPAPSIPPVAESTTVTSDARAVPIHHVELSAPGAGGVVAEVMVAEGDSVTAGQPLLRLDDAQAKVAVDEAQAAETSAAAGHARAKDALDQARAQVGAARAAVDQARAGVRIADANRDATPSGTDVRRAANAEVDRATAALRGARADLLAVTHGADVAEAQLGMAAADEDAAHARLTGARAALDDLTLEAPIAGIVASVDATAGQTVGGAEPVVRIADPSAWRFETIDLDEASIGRLAMGAKATVTVDAFEDVEIPATIASIAPFGVSSAGDIVYTVVLEPTGAVPEGLRWNMTASANIEATPGS